MSALKKLFPTLGSTLVREILHRSGLVSTAKSSEVDDSALSRIARSTEMIISELGKPSPLVYSQRDNGRETPSTFSLVELHHLDDLDKKQFDDINDAIRFFISRRYTSRAFDNQKEKLVSAIHQQIRKAQRSVGAIEQDMLKTDRGKEYELIGKSLMTNLGSLTKGMKTAHLMLDGQAFEAVLDARLSPVENAQRYFDKAKKTKLAQQQGATRLDELRRKIRRGEALLAHLDTVTTKGEIKEFTTERAVALEEFGLGEKSREREQLPFRIFSVDGGFEVWAGKSSANNDLLTMKFAKPNDLWFHARGSSGSHVVLKVGTGKGEVSKRAKEQAAAIAAYYSKMKGATMVPVAMTEKKYVRKPKGSPPGTVVLEREKVIFAEPKLPYEEE
jgi:predicted ribosome quality control (RQC) complex YloA/Tae2 family protein